MVLLTGYVKAMRSTLALELNSQNLAFDEGGTKITAGRHTHNKNYLSKFASSMIIMLN